MASERARGIARDIRLYNRGFEVSDAWIDEHIAAIVEAEHDGGCDHGAQIISAVADACGEFLVTPTGNPEVDIVTSVKRLAQGIRDRQRGEPSQGGAWPHGKSAGRECHLCKGDIYDGKHVIGIPGRVKCPQEGERPEPGGGKG